MDIENYLTGEEKKQMESLMKKAAERRRQSTGKPDGEASGMYFEFKMGVGKNPKEIVQQRTEDDGELQNLLGQLYDYCKAHGYDRQQEDPPWMHEIDEELPIL